MEKKCETLARITTILKDVIQNKVISGFLIVYYRVLMLRMPRDSGFYYFYIYTLISTSAWLPFYTLVSNFSVPLLSATIPFYLFTLSMGLEDG